MADTPPTGSPNLDLAQAMADTNWQLAKGYLRAVVAVQGARLRGGALNEHETKYERLESLVNEFVEGVEGLELNL